MNSDAKEDGDIWKIGYIPKNAIVCGGWIATDDLDTGTEALDIDVGFDANGAGSVTWTDPRYRRHVHQCPRPLPILTASAMLVFMTGDGTGEVYQAGVNFRQFVLPVPLWFAANTMVHLEANAAAAPRQTERLPSICCIVCADGNAVILQRLQRESSLKACTI